jgi:hypothetical protein
MTPAIAGKHLDDLSTDGDKIYSDLRKPADVAVKKYGIDIPVG